MAADPPQASWRQDVSVAAATLIAGLLGYGVSLVLSHALRPAGFGELSVLLAVAIVAAVPGTALQANVARRVVTGGRADDPAVLGPALTVSVLVGLAVLAIGPVLRTALDVRSWASIVWLAVSMVPMTLSYGFLGVLQGSRRFGALAALLVVIQSARLAAAVFAAISGTGVAGAMAGTAVAVGAVVTVACVVVGPRPSRRPGGVTHGVLARDTVAMLAVLVMSSIDLVLARHYLSGHASGLYAAGNLVSKIAFWGLSFVSMVSYPRLVSASERPAALRRGASGLVALGGLATAAAAIGAPLVPLVIGSAYRSIAGTAWLFALQGALLAAVLFGVYAGVAVGRRGLSHAVWIVCGAEAIAITVRWHESIDQILVVAAISAAVLVVAAIVQFRV